VSETDDVVALTRLQSRYADIISRRAFTELSEVFRPTTTVHVDTVTAPPQTFTGPDELGSFVAAALDRFDHFVFAVLNAVVDLRDSDHATGRVFMCEIRHDRASDTWPIAHGLYQDTYVRIEDRWWFETRRYRSMARTGPEAAVFGLPPVDPPH
jgi:hypothetical protein